MLGGHGAATQGEGGTLPGDGRSRCWWGTPGGCTGNMTSYVFAQDPSCYSHWRSFISISSSRVRRITTNITQATRTLLRLALSKNTCHAAALFPQHGLSQVDLRGQEWGEALRGGPQRPCSQPPTTLFPLWLPEETRSQSGGCGVELQRGVSWGI